MIDSLATLGLIVDASGAQREIKLTTEQLKTLANGGRDAQQVMKSLAPSSVVQQMQRTADAVRQNNTALTSNIQASVRAAASHEGLGGAMANVARHAEAGHLSLGRVNLALEALAFETIGVNGRLGSIATKFTEFGIGGVYTAAILGGLALVAKGWDLVSEATRKAKEEHDKYVKSLGENANAGDTAKLSQMGRGLLYGSPFDDSGKLVENSKLVAGAFKGSLADMEATYAELMKQVPKGAEYAKGQLAKDINELVPKLNDARDKFKAFQTAMANLADQPAGVPGQIIGTTSSAESNEKIQNDQAKAIEDYLALLADSNAQQRRLRQEQEDDAVRILEDQIRQEDELRQSGITDQLDALNDAMHQQQRIYQQQSDEAIRILEDQIRKEEELSKRRKQMLLDSGLQLLSTFGGSAGGFLSGLGSSIVSGAQAAGPWGAAIAGATTLATSLFSMGQASKQAAAAMAQLQTSLSNTILQWKADLGQPGAAGALQQAQVHQQADDARKQLAALFPGMDNAFIRSHNYTQAQRDDYARRLKEIDDLEAQRSASLQKQSAILEAQSKIDAFGPIIDSLKAFRGSLLLSDQSTLSPTQKLAEARKQYEDILAKARAGDQTAAGQLPQFAQAFLAASRAVNASGASYQRDFAQVLRENDEITRLFEGQRDIAQQQLDILKGIQSGGASAANTAHTDATTTQTLIGVLINRIDKMGDPVQTEYQT